MKAKEFNKLRPSEKWSLWKKQTGIWKCYKCNAELIDGPDRASPFPGASIHCGGCGTELTRRTSGAQSDPFCWVLEN